MKWSPEQQAIFAVFADPNSGNAIVRARAGTGKTTTIIQALTHIPRGHRALLTAFNKKNADELASRLASAGARGADASTLHAFGCRLVRGAVSYIRVDKSAASSLIKNAFRDAPDEAVTIIARLMSKAKNCLLPELLSAETLTDLAYDFDVLPSEDIESHRRVNGRMVRTLWDLPKIVACAQEALDITIEQINTCSNKTLTIDFDDMVWLPVAWGLHKHSFDLVVVDECQDMSPVQLALARGACKKDGGRFIAVGDDRQAIYAFRGADSESLDRIKIELKARELPLPITYRCPSLVVAMAQEVVPDYRAHDSNAEGIVERLSPDLLSSVVKPGCFVLGRSNRAVVGACMRLLRDGIAAEVVGRDIGRSIQKLIERIAGKRTTRINQLLLKLEEYEERQLARIEILAKGRADEEQRMVERMEDQTETIRALCEGLVTLSELDDRIKQLFGEGASVARVTCSTVHRAKGMERDLVVVLEDSMKRGHGEDDNIYYVAITRAKRTLVMLSKKYEEKIEPGAEQ